MIPKTELRYSRNYISKWISGFSYNDLEKLKNSCRRFENIYDNNIKEILKLIKKYSGDEWDRKYIPIYIVRRRNSFSDPLTLRYKKNPKFMLVILIHELLHCNLKNQRDFKNGKDLHSFMEGIVKKVIKKLNINLNEEESEMNDMVRRKSP